MLDLRSRLLKQKSVAWVGGVKDVYMAAVFYFNAASFVLLAITAYNTTFIPILAQRGIHWLTLPMFISGGIGLILLLMLLEYKLVYPSFYAFRNKQEYTHKNLLREDLEATYKRLEKLNEKLKELEDNAHKT